MNTNITFPNALNETNTEIKEREARFKGASKEQKRVLIALDVIQQIKSGLFIPSQGYFVKFDSEINPYYSENKPKSIQFEFLNNKKPCSCCALGGMMLSCTLFNNQETFADYENNFAYLGTTLFEKEIHRERNIKNQFDKIFSIKQLGLIENAFEKGRGYFKERALRNTRGRFSSQEIEKAISFGEQYKDKSYRLIAIMKNIVDHDGTFDPTDKGWIKYNPERLISKYL